MTAFNGLGMNLGNLARLSPAKTRSISAENPTGEKGQGGKATEGTGANCARDLGQGWKVSPSVRIEPGQCYTLADIEGPGAIQSMWLSGDVARQGPRARVGEQSRLAPVPEAEHQRTVSWLWLGADDPHTPGELEQSKKQCGEEREERG